MKKHLKNLSREELYKLYAMINKTGIEYKYTDGYGSFITSKDTAPIGNTGYGYEYGYNKLEIASGCNSTRYTPYFITTAPSNNSYKLETPLNSDNLIEYINSKYGSEMKKEIDFNNVHDYSLSQIIKIMTIPELEKFDFILTKHGSFSIGFGGKFYNFGTLEEFSQHCLDLINPRSKNPMKDLLDIADKL